MVVLGVTSAFVVAIVAFSIGVSIVQFRRITPLAFCCVRCHAEFRQPPHRDYPRACPRCRARDWAG